MSNILMSDSTPAIWNICEAARQPFLYFPLPIYCATTTAPPAETAVKRQMKIVQIILSNPTPATTASPAWLTNGFSSVADHHCINKTYDHLKQLFNEQRDDHGFQHSIRKYYFIFGNLLLRFYQIQSIWHTSLAPFEKKTEDHPLSFYISLLSTFRYRKEDTCLQQHHQLHAAPSSS